MSEAAAQTETTHLDESSDAVIKELPTLPDEVWSSVFSLLSSSDIFSVRSVCSGFRDISNHNQLWGTIIKLDKPEAYHSIALHNQYSSVRERLVNTLTAAVTNLKLSSESLSPPCQSMQCYMKHCISVQNQHVGRYKLSGQEFTDNYMEYDCDGVILAISTSDDQLHIWFVSGYFKHIHTIHLQSYARHINIEGDHLAVVIANEIVVYTVHHQELTFAYTHSIPVSGGYVRFSGDKIAVLEHSSPGVVKLYSLSSGESQGSILIDFHLQQEDDNVPLWPSSFELKHKYVYFIHHTYEGTTSSLCSCYDSVTGDKVFEKCFAGSDLYNLSVSADCRLLFAEEISSECAHMYGVFINGTTGNIQLCTRRESSAVQPAIHMDWKNNRMIIFYHHYRKDCDTEPMVCGEVRVVNGRAHPNPILYLMHVDPAILEESDEDSEYSNNRVMYVHNNLLFSLVDKKVVVRGLNDGEVKYKIPLPPTPDDDEWRKIIYIDDYKLIIKTETYIAFFTFMSNLQVTL